jgi:hypothetical protein
VEDVLAARLAEIAGEADPLLSPPEGPGPARSSARLEVRRPSRADRGGNRGILRSDRRGFRHSPRGQTRRSDPGRDDRCGRRRGSRSPDAPGPRHCGTNSPDRQARPGGAAAARPTGFQSRAGPRQPAFGYRSAIVLASARETSALQQPMSLFRGSRAGGTAWTARRIRAVDPRRLRRANKEAVRRVCQRRRANRQSPTTGPSPRGAPAGVADRLLDLVNVFVVILICYFSCSPTECRPARSLRGRRPRAARNDRGGARVAGSARCPGTAGLPP